MEELKNWEKPIIQVLEVSMTKDVCDPGKLLPGSDGTFDSTNNNAPCGS
ncbi:MAG: hypothetical protein RL000_721 [Bacteroidota bacterium]|jgi:hypothetical protein